MLGYFAYISRIIVLGSGVGNKGSGGRKGNSSGMVAFV